MENEETISAEDFCTHHSIQISFVEQLQEHGIIDTIIHDQKVLLPLSQLGALEKIVRLHFELSINIEGIETITHLLDRLEQMQHQINNLKNQLSAYEDD